MRLLLTLAIPAVLAVTASSAVTGLQATWRAAGATEGQATAGQSLWTREATGPDGKARSCATCHASDPRKAGRHATTGEPIDPLAPSVEPTRFTDAATIEKWFGRNCKWTWGRECTPQEKADFVAYVIQ